MSVATVFRAIAIWLVLLVLAVANGLLREAMLLKVLPQDAAFVVSGLLLIACVLLIALSSVRWLGLLGLGEYLLIGMLWLVLTVAFEFGFGILVRDQQPVALLDAYRFRDGNIWPLVLLVIALSPVIAAAVRGLVSKAK